MRLPAPDLIQSDCRKTKYCRSSASTWSTALSQLPESAVALSKGCLHFRDAHWAVTHATGA